MRHSELATTPLQKDIGVVAAIQFRLTSSVLPHHLPFQNAKFMMITAAQFHETCTIATRIFTKARAKISVPLLVTTTTY
jgi:hypothetical protein